MKSFINKIKQTFLSIKNILYVKDLNKKADIEKKLYFKMTNKNKFPSIKQIKYFHVVLSPQEKKLIKTLAIIIFLSFSYLGYNFYTNNTKIVQAEGGEYIEGIVGNPRHINPILSQTNDVDNDISKLVFSGLLKFDENNNLVNDVAKEYIVSNDQLNYTITIRDDVLWHESDKDTVEYLDANDVMATFNYITDSKYKSPLYISFKGVSITKITDHQVKFTLKKPYTPFPSLLTFGIMPSHIWDGIKAENISLAEYNLKPIGSGKWKYESFIKNKQGQIKSYTLAKNDKYYDKVPYINKITFKFYNTYDEVIDAFLNKEIMGINFVPQKNKEKLKISKNVIFNSLTFPQYTSIFFNENNNKLLQNIKLREALVKSINREKIIDYALDQEGVLINGPIPKGLIGYNKDLTYYEYNITEANELLQNLDWEKMDYDKYIEKEAEKALNTVKTEIKESDENEEEEEIDFSQATNNTEINNIKNNKETINELLDEKLTEIKNKVTGNTFFRVKDDEYLTVTLTTVDQPENIKSAELIKDFWQKIGIIVNLKFIPADQIMVDVIKPRNYEILLYGENVGYDPDPFPFWHSSQKDYPGLNLSLFENDKADKLIITARETNDNEERVTLYNNFQELINKELAAIFLYSPSYTYVQNNTVQGFNTNSIIIPADRFKNIENWYIKTKREFIKYSPKAY